MRTVLQEEAKQAALDKLDDETCLIIVDWAMQFLPLKYRETMCEFFGKRGLSWHISAVVTKKDRIVVLKSSALCIHVFSIFALRTITQLHRYLSIYFKPLKQSTKASGKHL